jgi:hypothetical protein
MERVGDREGQMERYCSTGQSPQRAVAPTEEEEDRSLLRKLDAGDVSGIFILANLGLGCFSKKKKPNPTLNL